ncbi:MAG: type II toxin-antitoxin system prevent-host-death family antitoxin, partial [Firmicutes bacterium]|nr:type II toxin-antitoxin system prevent-host-death family antitoxin [Bacillota bacterium]
DLRNKFTEIEKAVQDGEPVYLTKNGYGTMVVLSLDCYEALTKGVRMSSLVFNKAENNRPELTEAIKAAEASGNITAWTARAKLGKATPQEMQLLSSFLAKQGLDMDEYLASVSLVDRPENG